MAKAAKAAAAAKMAGGAISGAAGAAGKVVSGTVNTAGNAISGAHRMSLENQRVANDYAKSMRTQARAVDKTFGMTEEQFANLTKYDRADRAMDTTDRGLSLVERNWKAVLLIFIIVLILFFVFRNSIKGFVQRLVGKVKNSSIKNDIEEKTGQQCTLSDDEFETICVSILNNHAGGGENEYGAAVQMCKCQNQADWEMLKRTFGTRTLDRPWIVGDIDVSLEDLITKYWKNASSACTKLYSHLISRRIKDDAVLTFLSQHR